MNMAIKKPSCSLICFCSAIFLSLLGVSYSALDPLNPSFAALSGGTWVLLQPSIGISAMHMQLLHNNKVVIFDRTDFGASNLSLPAGKCRYNDEVLKPDCTAHSVIYDFLSNTFRPLMVQTDTWCSSGSLDANGVLVQTGGYLAGDHVIRTFTPCDDASCDWTELPDRLWHRRWYASNHILPDGRIIVVGGRKAFTYEFYPKNPANPKAFLLRFLLETRDAFGENNLYPFLHLLPDGNLFIFANRRSILFDYNSNLVVKEFPPIPGDDKRNYPSTASSVLLPLRLAVASPAMPVAEVMICGGALAGAFNKSEKEKIFVEASRTCGRLRVSDPNPMWFMEDMPMPRVMSDMILLPTGDVIIINGALNGTAGWEDAANPALNPLLYMPNEDPTQRFAVLAATKIARMYHSSAILLPDGRILVGGSNPHRSYNFTAHPYPTELSLEAYHPPYLSPDISPLRPSIVAVELDKTVSYGQGFSVTFMLTAYRAEVGVTVALMAPPFATHSFGMNQRMVVLHTVVVEQLSMVTYKVAVDGPTNGNVAPPGYCMLFVVHSGVPSYGVWVQVR